MKLWIGNMNCGGCARGVKAIIHDIDPNAKVDMELAAKVVNIDTIASVDQMMAALARDDFPAQVQ